MFNSAEEFDSWFGSKLESSGAAPITAEGDAGSPAASSLLQKEQVLVITNRLHQVLRPFLLRRTKAVLAAELPSKTEFAIACPVSGYQDAMLKLLRAKGQEAADGGGGGVQGINNVVMEMRKVRRLTRMLHSSRELLAGRTCCRTICWTYMLQDCMLDPTLQVCYTPE